MIEAFISKSAQGKTLCMIAEAAAQANKNVAFISLERHADAVLKTLDKMKVQAKSFKIFSPKNELNLEVWLIEKISELANDFEIICVDGIDFISFKGDISARAQREDLLNRINTACFNRLSAQCESLWITRPIINFIHSAEDGNVTLELLRQNEIKGLLRFKQVCRSMTHSLLPEKKYIEAVDLITKKVKIYNF